MFRRVKGFCGRDSVAPAAKDSYVRCGDSIAPPAAAFGAGVAVVGADGRPAGLSSLRPAADPKGGHFSSAHPLQEAVP